MEDCFRRDQKSGITPPDLAKDVDYADHIVKARGKRTQYTSVSKEPSRIRDFGDQVYQLKTAKLCDDGHVPVEHDALLVALVAQARDGQKAARQKAVQAVRYAKLRLEGLVDWRFDIMGGTTPSRRSRALRDRPHRAGPGRAKRGKAVTGRLSTVNCRLLTLQASESLAMPPATPGEGPAH